MKTRILITLILVVELLGSSSGQAPGTATRPSPPATPQPSPSPQRPAQSGDEDVVRITTKLVQVDAVITDRNGKLVTDLRPEELQIMEDGRPQKITHFIIITAGNAAGSPVVAVANRSAKTNDRNAPPAPPVILRPEDVRRSMAVVVDDLGLSAESIPYVRRALKKFVDDEMQPSDLVAIIRTGSGIGALQQFTSDKRMLYAAIDRVKWNPNGRSEVSAIRPFQSSAVDDFEGPELTVKKIEGIRDDYFETATLNAIGYVMRGMKEMPGRKSMLLLSDGIRGGGPGGGREEGNSIQDVLLRVADQANRGSVVIYAVDARGLQTLALTAGDNPRVTTASITRNPAGSRDLLTKRRVDFRQTQEGLSSLAKATGGFAILNDNDLNKGIRRVLDDQQSYYLIGYRPDDSTFDAKTGRQKFHSLTLKVTRPGKFIVRMRKGFYGVTDEELAAVAKTPEQQVIKALTSPFGAAEVEVRLTSLFGNNASLGSFLSSMLHVRATDLTFTDEADGWHKAEFDVVAVTFGDNGNVVDQVGRTHSIKVREDAYRRMLQDGFVYTVIVPIKKPGAYQLRVALRDHGSERIGSASQFVEVPDIKSGWLMLSGVLVIGVDPSDLKKPEPSRAGNSVANEGGSQSAEDPEAMDPTNSVAVRQFNRGQFVQYGVSVYNAELDKTAGRPHLQISVRLFHDNRPVLTGEPQEVNSTTAPDPKRVFAAGTIQLGTELAPGEYVLQVIVTDLLADQKHRTATQWIDFEIVK